LCERGRQYLRDWFTPNYDSAHYKSYQAKKKELEAAEKVRMDAEILPKIEPAQPPPPGRRWARKTEKQIEIERASRKTAEKNVHDYFLN